MENHVFLRLFWTEIVTNDKVGKMRRYNRYNRYILVQKKKRSSHRRERKTQE